VSLPFFSFTMLIGGSHFRQNKVK